MHPSVTETILIFHGVTTHNTADFEHDGESMVVFLNTSDTLFNTQEIC